MSNNKPIAVAIIKFYPNKHIEVELDTIEGITPRTLAIAENLLGKKYRSMKGEFLVKAHAKARQDKVDTAAAEKKADEAYHIKRDEELKKASEEALSNAESPEPVVVEEVVEEVVEPPVLDETEDSETVTGDEPK